MLDDYPIIDEFLEANAKYVDDLLTRIHDITSARSPKHFINFEEIDPMKQDLELVGSFNFKPTTYKDFYGIYHNVAQSRIRINRMRQNHRSDFDDDDNDDDEFEAFDEPDALGRERKRFRHYDDIETNLTVSPFRPPPPE